MIRAQRVLSLTFKAVAMAMGAACIVLSALKTGTTETYILLLSIGLFLVSLAAIQEHREE